MVVTLILFYHFSEDFLRVFQMIRHWAFFLMVGLSDEDSFTNAADDSMEQIIR